MKRPFFIGFLCITLFFSGCTSKKEDAQNQLNNLEKYREYISEMSHGIISAKTDVRVILNQPIESWGNGDELDKDLFLVSPKVKGRVVALNNRTIAFIPETKFEQDTEYNFTLLLGNIIRDVPKDLRKMSFSVKTIKQQFNVYTEPLQSYSKDRQFINGQIRSADQMSLHTAKSLLKAIHKGKEINIDFDETVKEGTQFQFKIDSIQRYDDDSELEISWNGSADNIESEGKNTVRIPGKNNFTVLEALVGTGENQLVLVNFSDPIKKGQNLKGLVVLEGADDPKFSIDGNTLKVYPNKEIKGVAQLEVFEGIESAEGNKLKSKFEERIAFEQVKPSLRLLSNGTILPSSSNLKINFETVNLKAVDVSVLKIYENNVLQFLQGNTLVGNYNLRSVARPIATKKITLETGLSNTSDKWSAHALDLKSLITPDPGAIYRVEFNFRPAYSNYKCSTTNFESERITMITTMIIIGTNGRTHAILLITMIKK